MGRRLSLRVAVLLGVAVFGAVECRGETSKISAVSLLLPTDRSYAKQASEDIGVTTVLTASPGCFEWISSDPKVINVQANRDDSCSSGLSSSATLTVIGNSPDACEVSAIGQSDQVLTVEVYTSHIHRIEILTTVRRLALFEPETVEVQAFDEEGNVFSSLDGLSFEWMTDSANEHKNSEKPLTISRISDSQVSQSHGLQQEYFGRFGYKVQVSGNRAGQGIVRADLSRTERGAISSTVVIDVVEPLSLCPSSPIVISGTSFSVVALRKLDKISYERIKGNYGGVYEYVAHSDSKGKTPISVDAATGLVTALEPGLSKLTFQQYDYHANAVTSLVRVVPLDGLRLWVAPIDAVPTQTQDHGIASLCAWSRFSRFPQDNNLPKFEHWKSMDEARWTLTQGKRYIFMATLVSNTVDEPNVIFVTDSMKFDFKERASRAQGGAQELAPGKISLVSQKITELPNVMVYDAKDAGFVDLDVSLNVAGETLKVAKSQIQITSPVKLDREVVRLPVDPAGNTVHAYKIIASGGTGHYTYAINSGEESVYDACAELLNSVKVDASQGLISLNGDKQTREIVTVEDAYDPSNRANLTVLASPPSQVKFLDEMYTISVGEKLDLPVSLLDESGFEYDNCTGMHSAFKWESSGGSVKMGQVQSADRNFCGKAQVTGVVPGVSTVTARMGDLFAKITVKVLEKAQILWPKPKVAVGGAAAAAAAALVPIGASSRVVVGGGTSKDSFQVFQRTKPSGEMIAVPQEHVNQHLDFVLSKSQDGTREYNIACKGLGEFEVVVQGGAALTFVCDKPISASISPVFTTDQIAARKGCDDDSNTIYAVADQSLNLHANFMDSKGRVFSDFTGYDTHWTVEPSDVKLIRSTDTGVATELARKLVLPKGFVGTATINVELTNSAFPEKTKKVQSIMHVIVPEDLYFDPKELPTLFADPSASEHLQIKGGSKALLKNMKCRSSNPQVASVDQKGRTVTVKYRAQGGPSKQLEAQVICSQSCLVGSSDAILPFKFRKAEKLHITGPARVKEGDSFKARLSASDTIGKKFSAKMLDFIPSTVSSKPASSFRIAPLGEPKCVGKSNDIGICDGEWEVDLVALESGPAVLQANSRSGLRDSHNIVVYKGISIDQEAEKVVEPGVEFKLQREFGPLKTPEACHFEVEKGSKIEMLDERKGLFRGNGPENAVISAICRDENNNVIDKASVSVKIQALTSMMVLPQISHVVQGEGVRLRTSFPEILDEPVDYDTIHRVFTWKVNNQTIAEIPGSSELGKSEFSLFVKGLEPGVATVTVESRTLSGSSPLVATATVAVERRLEVLGDKYILMPRHSQLALETNFDDLEELSNVKGLNYVSGTRGCAGCESMVVRVDNGIIFSDDKTGVSDVIVESRSTYEGIDLVQTRTVHVRVEEVAFVGIKELHNQLLFPVGAESQIHASLFDANGRQFTAPFSALDLSVNLSNSNIAKAHLMKRLASHRLERNPYRAIMVTGISEGATALVVGVESNVETNARRAYARISVMSASSALSLDFSPMLNSEGVLVIVPDEEVEIPIKSMSKMFINENMKTFVSCSATLGDTHLDAYVSNERSACIVKIPSHVAAQQDSSSSRLMLSLKTKNNEFNVEEIPLLFGFRLEDVSGGNGVISGPISWSVREPALVLDVIGANAESIVASSSDPRQIKVSQSERGFQFEKLSNMTCGKDIMLIFRHRETNQKVQVAVILECLEQLDENVLAQYPFHLKTTVLGTILVMLLLCCRCSSNSCTWATSSVPVNLVQQTSFKESAKTPQRSTGGYHRSPYTYRKSPGGVLT